MDIGFCKYYNTVWGWGAPIYVDLIYIFYIYLK